MKIPMPLLVLNALFALVLIWQDAQLRQSERDLKRQLGTAPAPAPFLELKAGQTLVIETNRKGPWEVFSSTPLGTDLKGRVRVRVQ